MVIATLWNHYIPTNEPEPTEPMKHPNYRSYRQLVLLKQDGWIEVNDCTLDGTRTWCLYTGTFYKVTTVGDATFIHIKHRENTFIYEVIRGVLGVEDVAPPEEDLWL